VYVRFAGPPPIDKIRKGLAERGLPNSSIQQISDISDPTSKNDVVIGLEQQGQGDQVLDAGKQTILDVLHKTFGGTAAASRISTPCRRHPGRLPHAERPAGRWASPLGDRYNQLAQRLVDARDKEHGGVVTDFAQLSNVDGANSA
jgi:hypothetical protein